MKLLHIIGSLDPILGGPVEALRQLTTAEKYRGNFVEIATLDKKDGAGHDWFSVPIHAIGPSFGKYRFNPNFVSWLLANAGNYDALIVHGIWQYQSFATWLASRKAGFPYFVFTHGALDPWFKNTYPLKHLKKWLYWPWAEYRVLRDARGVLFTSEEEARLAPKSFWLYKANECIVNYGILKPQGNPELQKQLFFEQYPELRNKRIVLFLSRIHPKKGADLLVEAFSKIANLDPDLVLVLAGPGQDSEVISLNNQADNLGISNRVIFTGMLTGDVKWGAFYAADVFALPSHSENFGVAVVESLACNLPVLITDKINIWQEVKADGAGLVDEDTFDGTLRLLENWMKLPSPDQKRMRSNARNCFISRFDLCNGVEKFNSIIHSRLNQTV